MYSTLSAVGPPLAPVTSSNRATPDEWARSLSGPADLSSSPQRWPSALLRHWTDTSPKMDQPSLDHHYIVQHLGGAKRVERRHDGPPISTVVECGAITIVPAGTEFRWHTHGPIEFAHLYISPALLEHTAKRFDRINELALVERVGCRDMLIESLFSAMLLALRQPCPAEEMYLDSLLESFMLKLLLSHTNARLRGPKPRETLPTFRLNRVVDYVETHLGSSMTLTDLTTIAGGSIFHFSRAFKNTTGYSPYQYVLRQRMLRAKQLLTTTDSTLTSIAKVCGFQDRVHFSRSFARIVGTTPSRFRRELDWIGCKRSCYRPRKPGAEHDR